MKQDKMPGARRERCRFIAAALCTAALLLAGCELFLDANARLERAEQRIAQHDYAAAEIELRNALQSQADHAQARLLLARVLLRRGELIDARRELERAIQAGAPVAETVELTAKLRLASGQPRELLAQMDADELPLPAPLDLIYRGRALLDIQQPEQAQKTFEQALQTHPASVEAATGLAMARAAQGELAAALAQLERLVEKLDESQPRWAETRLIMAGLYVRRGDFEQAERVLETARPHAATQLDALQRASLLVSLTETRMARGNLEAARAAQRELQSVFPQAPVTRMLAARLAMAAQDYDAAVAELQRLVAAAPELAQARFLLGAALLAQGTLNQAELQLAQALQRTPENIEARKLLAQVRLRLRRPEAAMQVLLAAPGSLVAGGGGTAGRPLENFTALDEAGGGRDPQLDALLGIAQLQQGQTRAGIARLEQAVASRPRDRELKLELAAAYLRNGENRKALTLLEGVPQSPLDMPLERLRVTAIGMVQGTQVAQRRIEDLLAGHPGDAALLNFAAEFHGHQRQFDQARALLAAAAQIAPEDTATFINRARIEVAAGQPKAAAQWLEDLLGRHPDNMPVRLVLADLAVRNGETARAIELLEQARRLRVDAFAPRLRLARLYAQVHDPAKTDTVLKELAEAAREHAEIADAVGQILLEAGRHGEALARFRQATDLAARMESSNEDRARYWLDVARAQLAMGDAAAAREALNAALVLQPQWPPTVGMLAAIDLRQERPEVALSRASALRQALPRDPAAITLEGDVLMALGRHAQASAAYDAASARQLSAALALKSYRARQQGGLREPTEPLRTWLQYQPGDNTVRTVLAQAYLDMGLTERAIGEYEIVIRERPDDALALNNLAWLYQTQGDIRAEETARRAHVLAPQVAAVADTYGWILVRNQKPAAGLKVLESALQVARQAAGSEQAARADPAYRELEYHHAAALAASGSPRQARERLEAMLRVRADAAPFASQAQARELLDSLPQS
ncbi:hypothetical protein ACG33_10200 [Steroidobacter denitrificans]|uniref:PEP-CTERM system TPR-repeat lipoprotein n=1 Tax=Steroidobacter denitrificans TaxID=465721 RepID=A0A127FAL5_STEDE|nr:tetratricopeptide repeat protein [Steroidobacter denitrificans]AMN47466.1 hypothetical protein ACG33_10200 [Steroidobacter denitrificans]